MVFDSLIESYGDPRYDDMHLTVLTMDRAYLRITLLRSDPIFVYNGYKECIGCPYVRDMGIFRKNVTRIISTEREVGYKILSTYQQYVFADSNNTVICNVDTDFKEFGIYDLIVGKDNCRVKVLKEPVNIYLPILTVVIIYSLLYSIVIISKTVIQNWNILKKTSEVKTTEEFDPETPFERKRLRSLDTFRGIVITLMIFVNYGAGGYKGIIHVIWFGLHLADVLFPCFLWIMGLCIPLAMHSRIKKEGTIVETVLHIFKRSGMLFLFGMALCSPLNLNKFRIFGALQRLAICYLFHAPICFITMKWDQHRANTVSKGTFTDIVRQKLSWFLIIIFMIIHTVVVLLVPFKNCPSGYFGPGGNHENRKYLTCTAGITGHIDRMVLGRHMFQHGFATKFYNSEHFDPEGLLGTLPALAHVSLGVQAGFTLLTFKNHKSRIKRWLIWGVITGLMGGSLCNFSWNGGIIPLCKHLWTTSFMLVTCGIAFISFTLCYVIIDVKKIWDGKPFIYPGMNSIVMYIGHTLTKGQLPFYWTFGKYDTHFMKLLANVTGTTLWILIAYFMYRKKIFLKI